MYRDNELAIRPIKKNDLHKIWELVYKEEAPEWKKWDAPYYPHFSMTYEEFMKEADLWVEEKDRWAVEVNGTFIGVVTYYWEHEPSHWLEIGIILYDSSRWGKGIGTRTLKIWVNHLFNTLPLVRVGFTTWSGNQRMIRVGEKLGMTMEAKIRKVRYYNEKYYDSIRMGMLREEWDIYKRENLHTDVSSLKE